MEKYEEWEGKNRTELVSYNVTFYEQYADYVENVDIRKGSAQENESTNNKITMLVSKRIAWGDSFPARGSHAVMAKKKSSISYKKTIMGRVGAKSRHRRRKDWKQSLEQTFRENEMKKKNVVEKKKQKRAKK